MGTTYTCLGRCCIQQIQYKLYPPCALTNGVQFPVLGMVLAAWVAALLIIAGDVESNPRSTTQHARFGYEMSAPNKYIHVSKHSSGAIPAMNT